MVQYAIPKINMLCNLCCLNLVSQQRTLCNIIIFGMAYSSFVIDIEQVTFVIEPEITLLPYYASFFYTQFENSNDVTPE